MDKIWQNKFRIAGCIFIIAYLAVSFNRQLVNTFKPFLNSYKDISRMLPKDDISQLKELAPPYYDIVNLINTYPDNANFYFMQYFGNSETAKTQWWYLYVLTRYLCYPRKIFCMHPVLYNENKDEFIRKFIGGAERYNGLDWIRSRNINYVILLDNGRLSIEPVDSKIYIKNERI